MCTEKKSLLNEYVSAVAELYGNSLCSVILFGSFARGTEHDGSDIDIMILTQLSQNEIEKQQAALSSLTFDYNFDYDLMIMPIVKNIDHFNKWVEAYPFYANVKKEGIELYAAFQSSHQCHDRQQQ